MSNGLKPFKSFLETIEKATNETSKREAFVILVATGFADTSIATNLALGAEYKVNFEKKGAIRRGAIDSFFGNLIIEFENDLVVTGDHAEDQLRAYTAGAWTEDGSPDRAYLAIAADGNKWRTYSPTIKDPNGPLDPDNVELHPLEDFQCNDASMAANLKGFLDRILYRKVLLLPSGDNFARDFGVDSAAFVQSNYLLLQQLQTLKGDSQFEVLRSAWEQSLELAYGSIDVTDDLFVQHTYLSIVARLLIWTALERRVINQDEIEDVLSGLYFKGIQIANLVEHDFFWWYLIPGSIDPAKTLVAVSNELASYDLSKVSEDILKPLYEQLVDPATRHDLGEFYTPDWLAEKVVHNALRDHDWKNSNFPKVLDPACGSGTFLRVAIHEIRDKQKKLAPNELLEIIRSHVIGIDVHPLAVTIARATYLLAINDLVAHTSEPISLPVYMANSLKMPPVARQADAFGGDDFLLDIDNTQYKVPVDFVFSGADYDDVVEKMIEIAESFGAPDSDLSDIPSATKSLLKDQLSKYDPTGGLVETISRMATNLAELVRDRRNSVHGFMLKNHYRPAMLRETFDYVVGNPPWLTVAGISTPEYKNLVISRANESKIAPRATGEASHTELASLFLVVAAEEFLKKTTKGTVAFLMPRSVITAKHHENLRRGIYKPRFSVEEIWDLDGVTPLFRIPACALFVRANTDPSPSSAKDGQIFAGRLRHKDMDPKEANKQLTSKSTNYYLRFLGKRSAWVPKESRHKGAKFESIVPTYSGQFRQGAIIYPQTLFVVVPASKSGRSVKTTRIKTDERARQNAKKAKTATANHIVETANLFYTAAADHIYPYTLSSDLWTVVLPTLADPGDMSFRPVDAKTLRSHGRIHTAKWLEWAERKWKAIRKEGDNQKLSPRLDYAGQFTAQGSMKRYVVIYAAAGKRPVGCVLDTNKCDLPFVARDRTYWSSFDKKTEAYFLSAFINSDHVAVAIQEWMNRGLFGPRDINKRVLDVPWPEFDPKNKDHKDLAQMCEMIAKQAAKLLAKNVAANLGKMRTSLRESVDSGLRKKIEKLVTKIAKG